MTIARKIIIGLSMVPIIIVGLILITFLERMFGYYPGNPGWEVAGIAIQKGKSVDECKKIIGVPWIGMGPNTAEQRVDCIREYASLSHDPTVCKLLMPSNYGMNCIGALWGSIIDTTNCHWYKDNAVRCFEGQKLIPHIFDCSKGNPSNQIDECKHRLAFKKKDPLLCNSIKNSTLSSICKVRIETWNSYPELRNTIYFNDDIE